MYDEEIEIELDDGFQFDTNDIDPETGEIKQKPPTLFTPTAEKSETRFSVSLIEDYMDCPAKAYGRITKQPGEKGISLVLGIAVHEAFEKLFKERKNPKDTYAKAFERECEINRIPLASTEVQKKRTEGDKMIGAGYTILSHQGQDGKPYYEKVDPAMVERFFRVKRNGRVFTGKIDLIAATNMPDYAILDFKTNKMAPGQYELDKKLQFSLYDWAAFTDPALPTCGIWPTRNVWLHLRGKNIAKNASGQTERKAELKKWKYNFETLRTQEEVERAFNETIEPVAEQIERGVWFRRENDQCTRCQFFNREKQKCGVTLPPRAKVQSESTSSQG